MDGSSPGEQQVQNKALLRPGLEPETSQPQRSALPLDHAGLVSIVVGVGFAPQFSLALTHIDDHVPNTATAFMMSVPMAAVAIGTVVGFPVGNSR